jgi:hypothetical protein
MNVYLTHEQIHKIVSQHDDVKITIPQLCIVVIISFIISSIVRWAKNKERQRTQRLYPFRL